MDDFFGFILEQERGRRMASVSAELLAAVLKGDMPSVATLRVKWLAINAFGQGLERTGDNASPGQVLASVLAQLPADFPDARTAKIAEIGAALTIRMASGFSYEDVTFQLDEAAQGRITALAVKASMVIAGTPGVEWPEGFAFIAADNSQKAFTAAEFVAFADAAASTVISRRLHARALKDAVLAAADDAAVAAIDITAGWD